MYTSVLGTGLTFQFFLFKLTWRNMKEEPKGDDENDFALLCW